MPLLFTFVMTLFPFASIGQGSKKVTPEQFKSNVVGNTIKDKVCKIDIKKNGRLVGKCQFSEASATLGGRFEVNNKGFCRSLTITYSTGRIREVPYTCAQPLWVGNDMKIGNSIYKIISKRKVMPNPLKTAFNNLSADLRRNVQINLKSKGFYNSSIDGSYGQGTEKALKNYNRSVLDGSDLRKTANVTVLLTKLSKVVKTEEEGVKIEVAKTKTASSDNETKNSISNEWEALAEEGSAKAQYKLALMYESGEGFLQDYVYAHMWANLSATNGFADARALRNDLAEKMTAAKIEEAQQLARECMKKKYKGC